MKGQPKMTLAAFSPKTPAIIFLNRLNACSSNVQMSVPSKLEMSVSAAVWWAVGGDIGGGAKGER
jgi:hypothetical protein